VLAPSVCVMPPVIVFLVCDEAADTIPDGTSVWTSTPRDPNDR